MGIFDKVDKGNTSGVEFNSGINQTEHEWFSHKNVYLIDSENVGSLWLDLVSVLKRNDEIMVFYTNTQHNSSVKIPYEHFIDFFTINRKKLSQIRFIRCNSGKNALDFQLSAEIGYLYKTRKDTNFIIFSQDTGFDALLDFKENLSHGNSISRLGPRDIEKLINFKRHYEFSNSPGIKNAKEVEIEEKIIYESDEPEISNLKILIRQAIPEIDPYEELLMEDIFKNSVGTSHDIHNLLKKQFGKNRGAKYFNQLKHLVNNLFDE